MWIVLLDSKQWNGIYNFTKNPVTAVSTNVNSFKLENIILSLNRKLYNYYCYGLVEHYCSKVVLQHWFVVKVIYELKADVKTMTLLSFNQHNKL